MSINSETRITDHERFAELCALSTTGSLTAAEWTQLRRHLSDCPDCRELLANYRAVAHTGMAILAADMAATEQACDPDHLWSQEDAKHRVMSRIGERFAGKAPEEPFQPSPRLGAPDGSFRLWTAACVAIAVFALLGAFVGYRLGFRKGSGMQASKTVQPFSDVILQQQMVDLLSRRTTLENGLAEKSKLINELADRAKRQEEDLQALKNLNRTLNEKVEQLAQEKNQQGQNLASVSKDRDLVSQRFQDAENSLKAVQNDLASLREQRQRDLLQSASVEAELAQVSTELRQRDEAIKQQQQFLASDRDIRELMGARQLYIADVFDVDGDGKAKRSFGRIFYTKSKSLVFYAFDLDHQPNVRDASIFQAWGRRGSDRARPLDMGILYMDSEANRRWVLKCDDPTLLAQIDAVFVTVEPKGGSRKPTTKPLLYAYLRGVPNHP